MDNPRTLSHDVYFTLEDSSAEARDALIAGSRKFLADHEGVVFFAAGFAGALGKRRCRLLRGRLAGGRLFLGYRLARGGLACGRAPRMGLSCMPGSDLYALRSLFPKHGGGDRLEGVANARDTVPTLLYRTLQTQQPNP